jgi:hypothetical protein
MVPNQPLVFAGETRLKRATDVLFGAPPVHRRSRIMVIAGNGINDRLPVLFRSLSGDNDRSLSRKAMGNSLSNTPTCSGNNCYACIQHR